MKLIDLDELKSIQIKILSYVDNLCRENNLRYSLCGGTLLGAVRHKGYIPWDDDIDIFLPRPDYEALLTLVNTDTASQYEAITCFNHKDYSKPFAKISDKATILQEPYDRAICSLGVNIDIFPEDGLPANKKEREKYWKRMRILKRIGTMVYQKEDPKAGFIKNIFRRGMFTFFKLFPANFIAKKLNKIATKHPFTESDTVAVIVFGYGTKEELPATLFSEIVNIPFEDKVFCAIKGYDTYLTSVYGNYMELPPKDHQIPKHDFVAYYTE